MKRIVGRIAAGALALTLALVAPATGKSGRPIFGVAVTPAHFPHQTPAELTAAFAQAAEIGAHAEIIVQWSDDPDAQIATLLTRQARSAGLRVHLAISPLALDEHRRTPAIPKRVQGASFRDAAVREAFKDAVMRYAELRPEYLGLGTEINLLEPNAAEFAAYVSLVQESCKLVKERYPSQAVTVSFQWDVMLTQKRFEPFKAVGSCIDVYSFTSYPGFAKAVDRLPADYYASVRKLLPRKRIAFSELGWSGTEPDSAEQQRLYVERLPQLLRDARPEFASWALLHDVKFFSGALSALNSVGLRGFDDQPKPAWGAALRLKF